MAITFDPANKIITLDSFNVSASQIWSRWVDWVVLADNSKHLPAFSQIGGVAPIALYLYLENGWKVRPQEADGLTTITGNLLVQGGGNPFLPTIGNFASQVFLEAPVSAQALAVGSGVTPQDKVDIGGEVWANIVGAKVALDVDFIKQIEGGKWDIIGNEMIFYREDNTTEIARFTLNNPITPTTRTRI